ncbi:MAG: RHS repeat-associated core domain-containing protein, partial [Chloroflexota bacterium]
MTTKTIGSSVDTYSYLGSTETAWQIVNTGGTGFTTKSALDATGARTAVTGNALTGYTGFDLHGNTALAENAAKVITDALRYDAWGELIASTTSALPTPWRYQGRLDVGPEAANPLVDFGARAYRPVTGAFTSLDSHAGAAIDPLSMNRFLYAEANPATFVDPTGHGVDCGMGEQCSATDRSNDLAASSTRTAPKPKPQSAAAQASIAADDRETAHIVTRVGGATGAQFVPTQEIERIRCRSPLPGVSSAGFCFGPDLIDLGPAPDSRTLLYTLSTEMAGGAVFLAATGVGVVPAAIFEAGSLLTGAAATRMDCGDGNTAGCIVGVVGAAAGLGGLGSTVGGAINLMSHVAAGFGLDYDA